MVLGKMEFAIVSFDRHIEREIFFKSMFEFDFEAKKFEIELSRLRLVKYAKDGRHLSNGHGSKIFIQSEIEEHNPSKYSLDAAVSLLRAFGRSQEFSNTERGGDNMSPADAPGKMQEASKDSPAVALSFQTSTAP